MNYNINNKTVLVTGSNRGIGKVILESFIENGAAKVYAAVRNVESVAPLIEKYGDKVVSIPIDLANPASIFAAAEQAQDVEIVISNAGVFRGGELFAEDIIAFLKFNWTGSKRYKKCMFPFKTATTFPSRIL